MKQVNKQRGFTLIELLIVIAIIGVLATIALPAYQQYSDKANFSEVVLATSAAKAAVEVCAMTKGKITGCNATSDKGVKAAEITTASGRIGSVLVTGKGIITATAANIDASGGAKATYILTPDLDNKRVTWEVSGTCEADGIC